MRICFIRSYEDLFFTNICLGYRSQGASGKLKPEWIKKDIGYLKELIEILEPKVIICLAKGKVVTVFAMAHCGAVGTMNRNRGALTGDDKLALQKKDWSAIKQYLV